jgi:riboflavin kinase/FMN adenylyltransferase
VPATVSYDYKTLTKAVSIVSCFIYKYGLMFVLSDIAGALSRGLVPPTAVTIGNFDGCHLGHQRLVAAVQEQARQLDATAMALTFDPRPEAYFKKGSDDRLLFTREQKLRAFAELGLDAVVVQRFDAAFSQTEASAFVDHCLTRELGARAVAVGVNFRFGRGRSGDAEALRERGRACGLRVLICEPSVDAGGVISSSRVRLALEQGDVAAASSMLGRPFLLEGSIVRGDQLGRMLDAPTANLGGIGQLVPKPGVYFVRALVGSAATVMTPASQTIPAICSIGFRPTLSLPQPTLRVETHLLAGTYGPDELYGKSLSLYFDDKHRDDLKFPGLDALKAAIATDLAAARRHYGLT